MTIKFVDELPKSKSIRDKKGKYADVPDVLRSNPGKWAMIGRDFPSYALRIKRGDMGFAPAGHFEAVSRNHGNGKSDIYVRFVGEVAE